jgi:NAD(P)-dependent dehydrogenase (short-subunit alcohol dehydrogenase family)
MNVLITGADNPRSLGEEILRRLQIRWICKVFNIPKIRLGNVFMLKQIVDKFISSIDNQIDMVVNNYAINHLSWIGETEEEDEEIIILNTMLPYWVINALVKRGDVCRVVNILSQTYKVPQRCTSLYCASKAAVAMMTKVMARELAPKGWVINGLAPGKILDTIMTEKTDKQVLELREWKAYEADKYALSLIPMGRFTTKEEVAEMVMKMLEMPDYVNGSIIDMTGGV